MKSKSQSGVDVFWAAPDQALFDQEVIADVRGCSTAKLERERWMGVGPRFFKDGRHCRYKKADVVKFLNRRAVGPTDDHAMAA